MAKMRVLHVVNSLDPGGMENGVVNIIRESTADFEFEVACLARKGAFAQRLQNPECVKVLGKRDRFSIRPVLNLALEVSRFRPDVIHTHNLGPLIYGALATLGGLRVPILHGEHSQLTPEECTPKRIRQRRVLYRFCRQIHTVSYSQRDELIDKGFARIAVVVNGVDAVRFCPGPTQERKIQLGIPKEALVMGIVGRFGPFKGHANLLEAFDSLSLDFPELHLLIVGGGGPLEETIVRKAKEQGNNRVHFTGFQSVPTPYYQAMDFLIVPSVNEGLSNAVLESMACGVPVLANSACGHAEVIGSGKEGILADLGSPEKISAAIRVLLESREQWPAWGKAAREKAVREFSLESMVQAYGKIYRAMVTMS